MSYEVVQIKRASPIQTVFTSEHYYEALDVFKEYFEKDKHARMDLVVRDVRDGKPLFRTIVAEFELAGAHGDFTSDGKPTLSSYANPTDWGRFGPKHTKGKSMKWSWGDNIMHTTPFPHSGCVQNKSVQNVLGTCGPQHSVSASRC